MARVVGDGTVLAALVTGMKSRTRTNEHKHENQFENGLLCRMACGDSRLSGLADERHRHGIRFHKFNPD